MLLSVALALCAPLSSLPAPQKEEAIASALAGLAGGGVLYSTGAGGDPPIAVAAGKSDPISNRPMSVDTPLRVASITKTLVAAVVLRLVERNRLDLDAAVGPLIDSRLADILRADGYDLDRITIRHLLTHSGGLYDHGADPRFIVAIFASPERRWTREALIRLATEYGDPVSEPGSAFQYSDAGYILLGDILERETGRSLAHVVREELGFDRLNLTSTWWEVFEPAPASAAPRGRQFIEGRDATDLHPSFDLFGGGGLVMSARDLATWFAALFEGRIFEHAATLDLMTMKGGHVGAERYRLGLVVDVIGENEVYGHSGFWGVVAYYDPVRRVAVAGYATRREDYRSGILPLVRGLVGAEPDGCVSAAAAVADQDSRVGG